ncbi:MAG: alkaline phosphatase family protein [Candidatus Baltobacteraceae bacterium]
MIELRRLLCILVVAAAGCAQDPIARNASAGIAPATAGGYAPSALKGPLHSKITHVVIIVQENRSVDDLFNGLPGADTQNYGLNSAGERVKLRQVKMTAPYDLDHEHRGFVIEDDGGKMDGFNLEHSTDCPGGNCGKRDIRAYGIVPPSEVQPYFTMAEQYAFADQMFQTNQGPSFPAHQYLLSGTSTISPGSSLRASENPFTPKQGYTGGCDAPTGSLVLLIDTNGEEDQQMYPCFDRPALSDLVDAKSLTWHYYQAHGGAGLWNGPDAIQHIRNSPEYATDVVWPSSQILTDISNGNLSNVVWVTPTAQASDHANITNGSGPDWVASVVNAIGESKYWKNTAIFVTWDDWGGWYDHVTPPEYNSYELGFRVPLIAISAYTPKGYVSHRKHEFGSILKFTEKIFGLGSLGTTDTRADDLMDCFDFSQQPRSFTPIPTKRNAQYFLHQPASMEDPDDD